MKSKITIIKDILLVYCGIYTFATLLNSILYLVNGVYEDPSGNWHEIDRALVSLVLVIAYALIRYLKIKSFLLKTVIVYFPTMGLIFLIVWLSGFREELAPSAYRDIFVNYSMGFIVVVIIAFISKKVWSFMKKRKKSAQRTR